MDDVTIVQYHVTDAGELLPLLLKLHKNYFQQHAPKELQELKEERDIKRSYKNYIDGLNDSNGDDWIIFLAKDAAGKIAGFIIGSIFEDEELVKGNIGILEDWFVEDGYRNKGVGTALYQKLETWFKKSGCDQVISDTWHGNTLSIDAHKELGFFVSGISFSKKL